MFNKTNAIWSVREPMDLTSIGSNLYDFFAAGLGEIWTYLSSLKIEEPTLPIIVNLPDELMRVTFTLSKDASPNATKKSTLPIIANLPDELMQVIFTLSKNDSPNAFKSVFYTCRATHKLYSPEETQILTARHSFYKDKSAQACKPFADILSFVLNDAFLLSARRYAILPLYQMLRYVPVKAVIYVFLEMPEYVNKNIYMQNMVKHYLGDIESNPLWKPLFIATCMPVLLKDLIDFDLNLALELLICLPCQESIDLKKKEILSKYLSISDEQAQSLIGSSSEQPSAQPLIPLLYKLIMRGFDISTLFLLLGKSHKSIIHHTTYEGITPLMQACQMLYRAGSGYKTFINYCLKQGVDVNQQDKNGKTALVYLLEGVKPDEHKGPNIKLNAIFQTVILLLKKGAKVDIVFTDPLTSTQKTVLTLAREIWDVLKDTMRKKMHVVVRHLK